MIYKEINNNYIIASRAYFLQERPPFYRRTRRRREAAPGAEGIEGDETKRQQPKGAAFVFNIHYSKTFQLPSGLSYTRSAWQKFRHRLGSFPQPAARRGASWRGGRRRRSAR